MLQKYVPQEVYEPVEDEDKVGIAEPANGVEPGELIISYNGKRAGENFLPESKNEDGKQIEVSTLSSPSDEVKKCPHKNEARLALVAKSKLREARKTQEFAKMLSACLEMFAEVKSAVVYGRDLNEDVRGFPLSTQSYYDPRLGIVVDDFNKSLSNPGRIVTGEDGKKYCVMYNESTKGLTDSHKMVLVEVET